MCGTLFRAQGLVCSGSLCLVFSELDTLSRASASLSSCSSVVTRVLSWSSEGMLGGFMGTRMRSSPSL
jgi:hypothetical protein